jgi:hypothetical protein
MPVNAGVEVIGLKEFRRDLKKIDPELQKSLRAEFVSLGREIADDARKDVPVRTGRARDSIKAGMSGNNAYIQGGKSTVPYYPWLDFGGVLRPTGARTNTQTRDFRKDGRYIYPAIDRARPKIETRAQQAFDTAARQALGHDPD